MRWRRIAMGSQGMRIVTIRWNWVLLAVIVLGLAAAPLGVDDYVATVLDTAGTYAIVAVGLNLLSGATGQFSLGHAGFYAIGAFTAGILGANAGWPFWLDIPAGGLLATVVGLGLGIPALRLSGHYLAIATLGFGLLVTEVLTNADWAGGRTGITLNPPQIGSSSLTDRSFFWIVLGVLLAGSAVAHNLRRGASGRAFVALRESEPAAQASGIDLARYRVTAFALSALYAGIAGALYAHWTGYISADNFDLPLSISFVAMIVVGGLDSTLGAIAGALFLTALSQVLQDQAQLAATLYGAIIVVALLVLPGGLAQLLGSLRIWRRARHAGVRVERSHG